MREMIKLEIYMNSVCMPDFKKELFKFLKSQGAGWKEGD